MGPNDAIKPFTCIHGASFGVDNAEDQVKRKLAFEQANPDWRIIWDEDYRVWRAWRLIEGGEDNLTRYQLRDLLDALETR